MLGIHQLLYFVPSNSGSSRRVADQEVLVWALGQADMYGRSSGLQRREMQRHLKWGRVRDYAGMVDLDDSGDGEAVRAVD